MSHEIDMSQDRPGEKVRETKFQIDLMTLQNL